MLKYIQCAIAVIVGIVASITDFKNQKIFNKTLIIAIICSLLTYVILYKEIETQYIISFILNLIIGIIISFLFFYFEIWAAGDAKMFITTLLMIPYEFYGANEKNIFPGMQLLIIIFSIAFIYVIIETIILSFKNEKKVKTIDIRTITKKDIIDLLLQYFMGYFFIIFINNITIQFFEQFRKYNELLMFLCNMLLLMFLYKRVNERKTTMKLLIIFIICNFLYYIIFGFQIYSINLKYVAIVAIIMVLRVVSEQYNYKEIKVKELQPKMILSYESIISFYGSRIKGLPTTTTETTKSRLTQEEVESIKRWSKTKIGKDTIVTVRYMPFAPFILTGEILFFIVKIICR